MKTIIKITLFYLATTFAYAADIRESSEVMQFPYGPRTTVKYFRGDNLILQKHIYEKIPDATLTCSYDFMYLGLPYTQYDIGPNKRQKTTYTQRIDNIRFNLSKTDKGEKSIPADCLVRALNKELETIPSHFMWIDSKGDGRDDRFYFIQFSETTHKWSLLEAYSIATDGTVTPVSNDTLKQWATEYDASANKPWKKK